MRAAILRNGGLVVDTMPEPVPEEGQVLVKTLACGICGSDLHALHSADRMVEAAKRSDSRNFRMDLSRDIVFGHEFCAEILDYGPGTGRNLKPGTRVCSMPVVLTGGKAETVGYSDKVPGGYAERMVLNETFLLEVPNGLPTGHAALTEPMAVGRHAVEKARLEGDEIPVVLGCGPVGLAVIAELKLKDIRPVIAADFSERRRKFAEQMGADIVLDPGKNSPYKKWEEEAAPEGYNPGDLMTMLGMGPQLRPGVVFECVGVPGIIQQILEGALPKARVVVVGVCMEPDHIEPFFAINKELNLQFVLGYTPEEFAGTLHNIAEGHIQVGPLITDRVGIDEVPRAFEELAKPDRHAKILIEPSR